MQARFGGGWNLLVYVRNAVVAISDFIAQKEWVE